ncbi:DUF3054 domain-containing protein [Natrarchaeobius chitinivorans]|uniref:DUF3054 domain-containing protein n=2 Tax=Natrarchaeobius chitinivorans TaxID=1679083 RepID=A0A3N6NAB3_NATCH|nr:DUF3054 domain-containing protein [Natrarchaeobius chitinivorans]
MGSSPSRDSFRPPVSAVFVAVGDVVILAAFVVLGLLMHQISPTSHPVYAIQTALPFLLAWLIVAPIVGAYASRTLRSVRRTLGVASLAWIVVSVLGAGIRATPFFHGGAPVEFVLVNLVVGLGFVLSWRILVAVSIPRLT